MTLKSAVNWKDCYKNLLKTVVDWSNWIGPTAQWIDFCDFHTDEDFLVYSYNPYGVNKDTGDITMLWFLDKVNNRAETKYTRRPTSGANNFYRDCFVLDDANMASFDPKYNYFLKTVDDIMHMFNVKLTDFIPQLNNETELGVEKVIRESSMSSSSNFDASPYLNDDLETVEDYYGYE